MKLSISATRQKGSLSRWLERLPRQLDKALDDEAQLIKADFAKSTGGWSTAVTFTVTSGSFSRKVGTTNRIYGFVNEGTPPHMIYPRGKFLFFNVPYTAKTRPGSLGSGGGGKGDTPVFAREVRHPGTKPRKFNELIADKARPRFYKRVKQAISIG
jgi:hypothetical protein